MKPCAKRRIALLLALLALFLCSCGNSDEISETDSRILEELGNELIDDLNKSILIHREDIEQLAAMGYVVSFDKKMLGSDPLAKFYVEYSENVDTQVTIILTTDSFRVIRVVSRGGKGFYLRYEYDDTNKDTLNVSGKLVDSVKLNYYESPPKWEMILLSGEKVTANFTFDNPQDIATPQDQS